jgi:hypothetical protein
MNWLTDLPSSQPIAWAVFAHMLIAVAGLAMAQIGRDLLSSRSIHESQTVYL